MPGRGTGDRELATENLDAGGPAYDNCALRHRYVHDAFADAVRAGQDSGDLHPALQPRLPARSSPS